MNKVWYKSTTAWLAIIGSLMSYLTDQQIVTLMPKSWAPYIGAVCLALAFIKRAIPSNAQGGLTLTADSTRVDPTGRT